jgi:hypothetical protein
MKSLKIIETADLFKKLTVNNTPKSRSQPCNKYGAHSMGMHGVGY